MLLHDLTLQDYAPSVVRVALATRSNLTTNVKTKIQIQINQQIDNHKYRWCVVRPASPYQLIITHDAATLCIAVSAIVPPIQTKITKAEALDSAAGTVCACAAEWDFANDENPDVPPHNADPEHEDSSTLWCHWSSH